VEFPHGKDKPSLCLFGADAIHRRWWPGLSVIVGIRDRIPPRVAVWLDREECGGSLVGYGFGGSV
jgi:hypothetical protein